jgi:hypothetical protein
VVGWFNPSLDPSLFLAVAEFVALLIEDGFAPPGTPARVAVRNYQVEFNKTALKKLDTDGYGGRKSIASRGIKIPPLP